VQLKEKWIDTGKLQWVSRDFPLDFHAEALRAAKAARCRGDQGKFWDMRLTLVRNATSLSPTFVEQQARALALNMKEFALCLETAEHDEDIQVDIASGRKIGVNGTPTFVIGRTPGTGPFNGILVAGALPYSALESHLTTLMTADK
jgi:protein-disulfide isomerase